MAWVTHWRRATFREEWYRDARREAEAGGGPPGRRREIVFAVCLAETYLYEWVRDHVFPDNAASLEATFGGGRIGIKDRWKQVLKDLYDQGNLASAPDFSTQRWVAFDRLVKYRDGLVHGGGSRPEDVTKPGSLKEPIPTPAALEELDPGWALNVAVDEIHALHAAAESDPPDWLVKV